MRNCSENPVLERGVKKPAKSKHASPAEATPVCREIAGDAIELQEFLQAQGRAQSWHMSDNHAAEDSWTYVRYFDGDELDKYADTMAVAKDVKFSHGKAAVSVRTTDIGGGFVRVQITARFLGEAKSDETVISQPAAQWPLASTGLLEKELFSTIEKNYHPLR